MKYFGNFTNGEQCGWGTAIFKNGARLEGLWMGNEIIALSDGLERVIFH